MGYQLKKGARMLKFLMAIILLTQINSVQALDESLSSEATETISEILQGEGIDEKRLILLPDPGKDEEGAIKGKFGGICCKRWIYGKGFVVNCVPWAGLVKNEAFRKSCSDMGGEERMFVGADEEEMRKKYGVDINFGY